MYHDRLSSASTAVPAGGSIGQEPQATARSAIPEALLGTRAALFLLLKQQPTRGRGRARVFRRDAGTSRPARTPSESAESAGSAAAPPTGASAPVSAPILHPLRDLLQDDIFDFRPLGA